MTIVTIRTSGTRGTRGMRVVRGVRVMKEPRAAPGRARRRGRRGRRARRGCDSKLGRGRTVVNGRPDSLDVVFVLFYELLSFARFKQSNPNIFANTRRAF